MSASDQMVGTALGAALTLADMDFSRGRETCGPDVEQMMSTLSAAGLRVHAWPYWLRLVRQQGLEATRAEFRAALERHPAGRRLTDPRPLNRVISDPG